MNSVKSWRAGAILVLAGGVLLTVAWLTAGTASFLPRVGFVGDLAVGLGLVLAGVGIRRRYPACWLLMVAGGAWLLDGVLIVVHAVVVLPREVVVAVLAIVAVTTVAAAIGVIVRGGVAGPARWVLVLPALATAALALGWVTAAPAALAALAPLVVGLVWLFVRDAPRQQAAVTVATPVERT